MSNKSYDSRRCRDHTIGPSVVRVDPDGYIYFPTTSPLSQSSDFSSTFGAVADRAAQSDQELSEKRRPVQQKWHKNFKSWLSVSEPTALALKNQRVSTYQRYGVDPKDPQAAVKMHLPIAKVPEGVTTSSSGPSPEKALRERVRKATIRQEFSHHGGSRSTTSGESSVQSVTDMRKAASQPGWTHKA
ncbi:hypothetical protein AAL_00168 [Moelleriella libera RCEF 2490]|uniref:Uncharacterized protein n=1 Tax=Moelleriella libera RCEF 2490 TaxID=1081109 RepID=A0A166UM06_9HYPO|nr:hypothetical protein AAL_00168 [Moelleriella libera RCEF 2490]